MRNDEQEKPKAARRTVSLDPELDAFALRRMKERGLTMFSHYVQDLVRRDTAALRAAALGAGSAAALLNEEPGNPQALPHTGAEILRPRKISAGGSVTPTIRYPKKQRGKSSK